jgi:hypothetical protein
MNETQDDEYERYETRYSEDGRTVLVVLRVDRRGYEFARAWAASHAEANPAGTAEDQLEGYLNMALMTHMDETDWNAPPEIEALYPRLSECKKSSEDPDDEVPF